MSKPNQLTRVIAVCDPGPTQQQIVTALNSQAEFQLLDVLSEPERLVREIANSNPQIILLDSSLGGAPTLDMIDDLALQFPESSVVTILPEHDPHLIQQMILAGARSFIVQPFTQINLVSTLNRVIELERRRNRTAVAKPADQQASRQLQTIAVFGPRGGSGCSTIALNLGIALFDQTGKRVLVFDGKPFFTHIDVLLNIRTQNTVADLIPHANSLDEALVKEVVVKHNSGIHVLLGPDNFQVAQGIRADDLYRIYLGLKRYYDYIVIDTGSSLTENSVTLMDSSDRILAVTTPDLPALHDISQFLQISRSLAYPAHKILILLNRDGAIGSVRSKDIKTVLPHAIYASIPEDGPSTLRSINRGIPLVVQYPRSLAAKAIRRLAAGLTQVKITEAEAAVELSPDSAKHEALLVSSQFG